MNDARKRDWQTTRIHFVCGLMIGGVSAFVMGGGWVAISIAGLAVGLFAAIFMDGFWDKS
jgi:hypothetical protein